MHMSEFAQNCARMQVPNNRKLLILKDFADVYIRKVSFVHGDNAGTARKCAKVRENARRGQNGDSGDSERPKTNEKARLFRSGFRG